MMTNTEISSANSKIKKLFLCRFIGTLSALLMIVCIIACKNKINTGDTTNEETLYQAIPTVCIWDKISSRKEPKRNSTVVSPLNLGETVTYLGINAIDSTNKDQEYLKVKLSDGSVVWVPAFSLITGSKPAVVSEEANIYLRPDLLTVTDRKLAIMDIIAVLEEKDGWVNFVSEKKAESGWIQDDKINHNQEEIAFSLTAKRILTELNSKSLMDKIDSVLNNNPFQNSVFIQMLKEIYEQEKEKKQIEELMRQKLDSLQQ